MLNPQTSASGLQRGDRAGSGRAVARRSLRKISPGTARRLSTVSNNNNNTNSSSNAQTNEGLERLRDQHQPHPAAVVSDVIRFDDDEYGDADSTDSREEEEEEEDAVQKAAKWSDDPADDSEEENPRFMLRRRR